MIEILTKEGMPCVEDADNKLTSEGLPAERYLTKDVDEAMDKIM